MRRQNTKLVHPKISYKIIGVLFDVYNELGLEVKQGERFLKKHFDQVLAYLKSSNLELGILAGFTSNGIKFKRILNLDSYIRKNP